MNNTLTAVKGLQVGHYTDADAVTGCTVILCPEGAVAGVDVRGSAPGTRETDLLNPINMVPGVHAVLLTGGSAYGLDAAGGVMRRLEERGIGFNVGVGVVPIVPAAVLFDLAVGRADVRPGPAEGYAACDAASTAPVAEGNVGAGTGATVGKLFGPGLATKSGLGSAARQIHGGITVGALAAVNAFGDVVDPATGRIIAGARLPDGSGYAGTLARMHGDPGGTLFAFGQNTTLAVVATDAALTKPAAAKIAQMAHDGLAQTIRPVHTMFDGDTVFALGTGQAGAGADAGILGAVAAAALAEAVLRAVRQAVALAGIPAAS
ncbi:MAG: P1 family peptidase [Anaerolineae bacterium]